MKDPIEIAREIVDAARCPCALGHELEEEDLYCPGCLRSMIAAAIVAERGAGTTEPGKLDDGGARCGVASPLSSTRDEGAGPAPASPAPACARCEGSGWDRTLNYNGGGMVGEEFDPCPACGGKP